MLARSVRDLPGDLTLGSLGIKTDKAGKLSFSETDFNKALEDRAARQGLDGG